MAQKISCRPLKGDTFEVEVDAEASVADLKTKISEKHPEMAADLQKLIHMGKILDDKSAVKDVGIKEGEFVVVMVAKAKPPAAPAAAPAATPTPAPAPTAGAAPGVDTGATAAATVVSGAAAEATVTQLMEMGFERAQVERCLQAAFGNPDRAVEYLMSGIPAGLMADEGTAAPPEGGADAPPSGGGGMAPSPAMTGAFPAMPTGGGAPGGGGGGANVAALEELRNHPRFGELAQAVAASPQMLPQILMALEQSNPGLVQVIRENPEAFMRLLAGAAGGGGGQQDPVSAMLAAAQGGAPGGGAPPGQQVVRLTPEEQEAVQRLIELGFDRGMAVQAYLACDKNEELAANFLFENAMQED